MPDVVVTIPKSFGLAKWIAEGDAAGMEWSGKYYYFSIGGGQPKIEAGERVYIVYDGKLRGYAPLFQLYWDYSIRRGGLVRAGGAVAVTIPEPVKGFRGWRYRWWERSKETCFPDWKVV
jgi:hypothetical protein